MIATLPSYPMSAMGRETSEPRGRSRSRRRGRASSSRTARSARSSEGDRVDLTGAVRVGAERRPDLRLPRRRSPNRRAGRRARRAARRRGPRPGSAGRRCRDDPTPACSIIWFQRIQYVAARLASSSGSNASGQCCGGKPYEAWVHDRTRERGCGGAATGTAVSIIGCGLVWKTRMPTSDRMVASGSRTWCSTTLPAGSRPTKGAASHDTSPSAAPKSGIVGGVGCEQHLVSARVTETTQNLRP